MTLGAAFFLGFTLLGGLALFLFGMQLMTEGLRSAAGEQLRVIIYRGTSHRMAGLALGGGLGFMMHSSATTTMTVGFLSAGLLSLANALPMMMGANIGTTLSMQMISFNLADYALFAVALGFFLHMVGGSQRLRSVGLSLLGFGLLFNGMDLMSGSIEPHRGALMPWLSHIDAATWPGMLLGILLATVFTAIVQSSGATVGMIFVLIGAGVFTSLEQVYPIVLGAHLGTTTTALIASAGCGIEGRRGAVGNLLFNVLNVGLALVAAPLFIGAAELSSGELVRQTANLHTAIMLVAALLLLPFTGLMAGFLKFLLPSRGSVVEPSYLDPALLERPENALAAVIRESRRSLGLLVHSMRETRIFLERPDVRRGLAGVRSAEKAVNEIRDATHDYLARITEHYLSRRQRLLAQYLSRITSDIERIGDNVMHLLTITEHQRRTPQADFDAETLDALLVMFDHAEAALVATWNSMDPDAARFPEAAHSIEDARDAFSEYSQRLRQAVNDRVAEHEVAAIAGIFFGNLTLSLDALVRHCRLIAREQQQPYFLLKPAKLNRVEPHAVEKLRPRRRDKDGAPGAD